MARMIMASETHPMVPAGADARPSFGPVTATRRLPSDLDTMILSIIKPSRLTGKPCIRLGEMEPYSVPTV